jgi:hypothetical protein
MQFSAMLLNKGINDSETVAQVWEEYRGLVKLLEKEDRFQQVWGDRRQAFHWINSIEYTYQDEKRRIAYTFTWWSARRAGR